MRILSLVLAKDHTMLFTFNYSRYRRRDGFTLVELMVVMAMLVAVGGMVFASYQGVAQTARVARTRAIIAACDSVIQEKYESYKYRPLAVEIPDLFRPSSNPAVEVGFETLAFESARTRMLMTRDLQRMEMPDRLSDIQSNPIQIFAAVSPVVVAATTGEIVGARNNPNQRRMMSVSWFDNPINMPVQNIPSQLSAYRNRLIGTTPTEQNQGAECLYLIMATSFVGGTPAIDSIPTSNIGDTDGDNLPEILDGWGQPLGFVRWPVGYVDPGGLVNRSIPDDFDLFRSDYAYASTAAVAQAYDVQNNTGVRPWSVRPLVFSVGSDGAAGITTNPWTSGGMEQTAFAYTGNWDWPVDVDHYGTELPGRNQGTGTLPLLFPDPFLRMFVDTNSSSGTFGGLLPGQQLTTSRAAEDRVDNITNYQLQATQ